MNKNTQAGLLIILLVIPAFLFVFLHFSGENVYTLSDAGVKDSIAILNPAANNCPSYQEEGVHRLPKFSFLTQDSTILSDDDLEGKILIADFFFTNCNNICLKMSSELARVQQEFRDDEDIVMLSHTVDPGNDTPSQLKKYAELYGALPNKWYFLTGTKESLYEHARCGYYIVAKPDEEKENDFIHSDKLVLVDKERRIRGYYSGTDREDVDRLLVEIRVLKQEK